MRRKMKMKTLMRSSATSVLWRISTLMSRLNKLWLVSFSVDNLTLRSFVDLHTHLASLSLPNAKCSELPSSHDSAWHRASDAPHGSDANSRAGTGPSILTIWIWNRTLVLSSEPRICFIILIAYFPSPYSSAIGVFLQYLFSRILFMSSMNFTKFLSLVLCHWCPAPGRHVSVCTR